MTPDVHCEKGVEFMIAAAQHRLFTIHDLEKMVESGILAEDERVELIEG